MKRNRLETFLTDMSYESKITFLEESKDKNELVEIAEKRGIKLPAEDIAPFKCIYAFVDRMNKNNCTLPKEEVEKALHTLVGKAVDFDHYRKRVVGYWIDAKLEGDEIIAYGVFFKGNFGDDYQFLKDLMEEDVLSISFEAWGSRDMKADGSYDLRDIEFAGGALLIKTNPAFPGSEVLEMAKQEKILEFAKVMTKPTNFVHAKEEDLETSRYYVYDIEAIMKAISEVECLSCKEKYTFEPLMIDFENNKVKVKCWYCDAELNIDLTPQAKLSKKGRKVKAMKDTVASAHIEDVNKFIEEFDGPDERLEMLLESTFDGPTLNYSQRLELSDEDFALVKVVNKENGNKKIRMLPIHNSAHLVKTYDRLVQAQVDDMAEKLGVPIDKVEGKIIRRARYIAMKKLLEKYNKSSVDEVMQEIAKANIDRELSKEELEQAYNLVELKGRNPDANATSLLSLKGKSTANPTSLVNANITEEDIIDIIQAMTKKPEESKNEDLVKAQEEISTLKTQLEEATAKLKEATDKLEEIAKAEKDAELAKRKEALGEYAKDMTDEQLMDEKDYQIATLKKEKDEALAKAKVEEKGSEKKEDLTVGADDKEVGSEEQVKRDKVNQYAFGKK